MRYSFVCDYHTLANCYIFLHATGVSFSINLYICTAYTLHTYYIRARIQTNGVLPLLHEIYILYICHNVVIYIEIVAERTRQIFRRQLIIKLRNL